MFIYNGLKKKKRNNTNLKCYDIYNFKIANNVICLKITKTDIGPSRSKTQNYIIYIFRIINNRTELPTTFE